MEQEVCGIAIGNYQATVAVFKNGRVEVLANASGERATPMLVSYSDSGMLVGVPAKQAFYRNADCTAEAMPAVLKSRSNGPDYEASVGKIKHKLEVREGIVGYTLSQSGREPLFLPAKSALTEVLKTLADTARRCISHSSVPVVLAISPACPPTLVETFRECATSADLEVLSCASEPSLSVLAYGIGCEEDTFLGHILVYDLGVQTLNITLLHSAQGLMRKIYSSSFDDLGGAMLDAALVDLLKEEYKRIFLSEFKGGQRALLKMAAAAEAAKHALSSQQSASVCIESLHNGMDFQCTVSRGKFEGMCLLQFKSFLRPVADVLQACTLTTEEISKVVLTGGCCKIPYLQQMMREYFPSGQVLCTIPPDFVPVMGAAMQGSFIQRFPKVPHPAPQSLPTLPSDLWILIEHCSKPSVELLLCKGTPLPCVKCLTLFPKPEPIGEGVSLILREGTEQVIAQVKIPCQLVPGHDSLHLRIEFRWHSVNEEQKIELSVTEVWSGWSQCRAVESYGTISEQTHLQSPVSF